MSADWTTCRVVRDRDGDLWFRGCDSDDLWTANTNYPDVFLTTDEVLTVFGPLTPVLDADGLPVVTTVGDLTARHLGKRMQVEGCAEALRAERDARSSERDALAAKVERVRALADLIDRHTEYERDPVDFRDASHGGSWDDVADRIRRALDEEAQP